MQGEIVGDVKPALLILLGAVAFVLLIACANVANLLLARAAARHKEIALRLALGADRVRLLKTASGRKRPSVPDRRQCLSRLCPDRASPFGAIHSRERGPRKHHCARPIVLIFTLFISLLTGVVFGLAPASQTSHPDLNEALKEGGRDSGASVRGNRIRNVLVLAEVAVSFILLIGAGLLINSFFHLRNLDP